MYTNNIKHKHVSYLKLFQYLFIYWVFILALFIIVLNIQKNLSLLVWVMSSKFSILASAVKLHYWIHSIFETLTFCWLDFSISLSWFK